MNCRRGFLLWLVLLLCGATTAQQRWMRVYDQLNGSELVGGVCLYPDTTYRFASSHLVAAGTIMTPTAVAANGDTVWCRRYDLMDISLNSGVSRVVQKRSDGTWLWAGAATISGGAETDGALFCFSANGDSLWYRAYSEPGFSSFGGLCLLPDDGMCVVGARNNGQNDVYVVRLDPAGDTLWTKVFDDSESEVGYSIIATQNGGFVIGAQSTIDFYDSDVWLVRVDASGDLLWHQAYGGPNRETGGMVAELPNGDLLVAAGYGTIQAPASRANPYLLQLDVQGTVLWDTIIPDSVYHSLVTIPLIMADGTFIVAGQRIVSGTSYGTLLKLEEPGNRIWQRQYRTSEIHDQYIYDVRRTLDGGFIMAGTAFDSIAPITQDAWLIKTDSFGCLVPGCQVIDGIQEHYTDLMGSLTVSPNPTSDLVQVQLDLPPDFQTRGALRLVLVDGVGRIVLEQTVERYGSTVQMDLTPCAAGLHYLHLRDDSRWLSGTKLFVE